MNGRAQVQAVRIYPSGGLICQKVHPVNVLGVPRAVRQLLTGEAVYVDLKDLHVFLVALEAVELVRSTIQE
jgi:hypothetical protein